VAGLLVAGLLVAGLLVAGLLGTGLAQPGLALSPEEAAEVLSAATTLLETLEPVALYQLAPRRGGGPPRPRPVELRLGQGGRAFARLALHPRGLQPLPLGFETRVPPLPPRLSPEGVLAHVRDRVLGELSLANLVLDEGEGYRLLLVYRGRSVGEMQLSRALEPRDMSDWQDEHARSPWRYP
jgi:hypothetical protein